MLKSDLDIWPGPDLFTEKSQIRPWNWAAQKSAITIKSDTVKEMQNMWSLISIVLDILYAFKIWNTVCLYTQATHFDCSLCFVQEYIWRKHGEPVWKQSVVW